MKLTQYLRTTSTHRTATPVAFTHSSTTPGAQYTRRQLGTTPIIRKTRRTYIKGV